MPHHGNGPIPARIMIVGEAWGAEEDRKGEPFVGASGFELDKMLHEAGIMRSECFVSNLVNYRPPNNDISAWIAQRKKDRTAEHVQLRDRWVLPIIKQGYEALMKEIEVVQPNLIIALGNTPMWALTGNWGIMKWRGSQLRLDRASPGGQASSPPPKLIPTIHPAAVLREWSLRAAVVADLRRASRHQFDRTYNPPAWQFTIRPTFDSVMATLKSFQRWADEGADLVLDLDIETRAGHIACLGLSWSRTQGVVIPLMCMENTDGYWSAEEEAMIVYELYKVCTNPRISVRWQNGLYDAQYLFRHWHFIPRGFQDTMISQHAMFSDQPKALAYQASIYCDWYVYWKDEGKTWDRKMGEDQLWVYNAQDCIYTRECGEVELSNLEKFSANGWDKAIEVHRFQQAMFYPVLQAMIRGIRMIKDERNRVAMEIQEQISHREAVLEQLVGHSINPKSPKQMMDFFYTDLNQPVVMTRAKKGVPPRPTCDDEALQKIAAREPLLKPVINCIADIRTLNILLSTFVLTRLDVDGRMRCSYNIGGSESGKSAPKTYRLSSSENAFGSGGNLQNIPSEKSKSVGKSVQRGHLAVIGDPYHLPNIRSLYGPDPSYTCFDLDLDRADLQVVVWEADDAQLKTALRTGADIHLLNAYVLAGKEPPPLEELVESHPRYADHRGPYKLQREFAKVFCHATNYVGSARTISGHLGRTVAEVDRAQKIWFGAHPGIKRWHENILAQISKRRFVENKFGYRWYIFDRVESVLPEAVAWIPQSTVSIIINRIWMNLFQGRPEAEWDLSIDHLLKLLHRGNPLNIQVQLQVHDSLVGQFPTFRKDACIARIKELSSIIVPYDDPLIIPTGIGTSETSWGDC